MELRYIFQVLTNRCYEQTWHMCLISGQVVRVAKTRIFVAPMKTKSPRGFLRQLTVYSNYVATKSGGAMILPFPSNEDSNDAMRGCQFFDLSGYKNLFEDLDLLCWPKRKSRSVSLTKTLDNSLQVYQVGSYQSVIPNVEDFTRLHQSFQINPELVRFMQHTYPYQFSFVVCQLEKEKEYHPFAYVHDTIHTGGLFIPTMHWHQHQADSPPHVDWDHCIYMSNCRLNHPPRQFLQSQNVHNDMNNSLRLNDCLTIWNILVTFNLSRFKIIMAIMTCLQSRLDSLL